MEQAKLDVRTEWEKKVDAEKELANIQETPTTELLVLPLTEEEKAKCMEEVVTLSQELKEAEKFLKDETRRLKGHVSDIKAVIAGVVYKCENGMEKRVDCIKSINFETKIVTFKTKEGKVLAERGIWDSEKQLTLDDEVARHVEKSFSDAPLEGLSEATRENVSALDF